MASTSRPVLLDSDGDTLMADPQPEQRASLTDSTWTTAYPPNPRPQYLGWRLQPPSFETFSTSSQPSSFLRYGLDGDMQPNRQNPSFGQPSILYGAFGNLRHLPPPQPRQTTTYSTEPSPPSNLTSIFSQEAPRPPHGAASSSTLPGHMYVSVDGHQYMPTQAQPPPQQPPPSPRTNDRGSQTLSPGSTFFLRTRDSLELIEEGKLQQSTGDSWSTQEPPLSPARFHESSQESDSGSSSDRESFDVADPDPSNTRRLQREPYPGNDNIDERPQTPRPHPRRQHGMSRSPKLMKPCTACMEQFENDLLLNLGCACRYCVQCLNLSFRAGCANMASFPPKCCGKPLRISIWGSMLEPDVLARYKEVEAEFSAHRPLYCAEKRCSEFMSEDSDLHGEEAVHCVKCNSVTCKRCGKEMDSHEQWEVDARICPAQDADVAALFDLGNERKWKQCPTCLTMVERVDGCNHMDCVCGIEFCYSCGKLFDEDDSCDCDPNAWDGEERDESDDEDEDEEEWPDFRAAVDALGRPTCYHWDVESLEQHEPGICHGCLVSNHDLWECHGCHVELCSGCLHRVQAMEPTVAGTKDTDEDE